jgi:ketosteroid isomerase-like protein
VVTGGAIQEYWQGILGLGVTNGVLKTVSLEEHGDVAVEEGQYEMRASAAVVDTGKYVVVHRRQPDGGWRWGLDIWNSDSAPKPG